ncbi:MAG: carbohydrate-binding protein, partial [Eubacterium sp.]|nr:carbohydrate-binding protein [Eubacterium sp.]
KRVRTVVSILLAVSLMISLLPVIGLQEKTTVKAAGWRSALYPEDWTPGYSINNGTQYIQDFSYAGYEKGEKALPTTMSGTTANVLDYGADSTGGNDSTTAIQNAINAVQNAGGGTIYLPAGTYKVKPSGTGAAALKITGSNILFKGDGIGKTFIRCYAENMMNSQVILVQGDAAWDTVNGASTNLSKDITKPTTSIPVNSTSGFAVGDYVVVRSDRTQGFIDEHQMNGFWSASLNPTTMGPTFYRQVTAVNTSNNTIEVDIPTRYALKTRDSARIYKVKTPTRRNIGLMDFSIGNKMNPKTNGWGEEDYKTSGTGAYEANQAFLIKFSNCVNCFAKNIATYQAGNSSQIHMTSNGLDLNRTRNVTIDHCDFSYPQYEGGGGNGYGINLCGQETLIKNCSSTSARHSFAFKYSYANGNVIYHYTSTDPKYGSDFHMYLSMSNLIDNEELNGDFVETHVRPYGGTDGNRHGVTSSQTVFWNTKGNRYKSGTNYIIDSRQHGYGYIIGTQGAATSVKTTPTSESSTYGNPNTAPEDYKEGIGQAAELIPQSLYYDQLEKRLAREGGQTTTINDIPGTVSVGAFSSKTDSITMNRTGNTLYAGNLNSNKELNYSVNVAESGNYNFTFKFAAGDTQWNAKNMIIKVDGQTAATIPVIGSTGWENFVDHNATISMTAGQHTLSIIADGGSCNVADFSAQKSNGSSENSTTEPQVPDATLPEENLTTNESRVVGYLPSYRLGSLNSIDFSALTHCVLSFMTYSNGTLTSGFSAANTQSVVNQCHQNGVKAMIAIGGGGGFNTSDNPFGTAAKRTSIVNQIMNYVDTYNLDGVDIDIEVSDSNTWANFDSFISELSGRLKAENKLLTMAVSSWFTGSISNSTYNYFDFINLMTYDENAGNGPVASMNFVNNQISHYTGKGISKDRLTIGVPFYGYGPGGYADAFTYGEIISAGANNRNSDTATINGKTVYYNGETTIRQKAELSKSYGGIMIWELGQDSFGTYSLLKAIKEVIGTGTTVTNPTITAIPGTVPVDSFVSKSSEITITSGNPTYAGNLKNASELNYYIRVPEAGKYTITMKLAAGNAQYNAKNMLVKLNNETVATVPVQASADWTTFIEHTAELQFAAKGEYKISLVSDSGACNVTDFVIAKKAQETTTEEPTTQEPTTEEPTTEPVQTKASIMINGCQMSASANGFRVVYSVNDPESEVAKSGLVYGLTEYAADSELYVGIGTRSVYAFESNANAKLQKNYSNGQSYAMTMKNIKSAEFYNASISVKAFVQLKNGTYVYSDVKKFTVYNLAHYLYQNRMMNNAAGHIYLYKNILTVTNPNYKEVDFDWNKTLVS